MKVEKYVPVQPLNEVPDGPYVMHGQREEVLSEALRGVELGTYDELVKHWLVRHLDNTTMKVLVSLFERTRQAGGLDMLDLEVKLRERQS